MKTLLSIVIITLMYAGGVYVVTEERRTPSEAVGTAPRVFSSRQLAENPQNTYILSTDGSGNQWIANTGGGGSGGGLFDVDLVNNVIFPFRTGTTSGTTTIQANKFIATSTTEASTFAGGLVSQASSTFTSTTNHAATSTWASGIHTVMHGIYAKDSSGLHLHANNGTEVAYFGAGGGANITFPNYTSALLLTGASGALAEYTGTTCTNQFVRSLSALGVATCESVVSDDITDGTIVNADINNSAAIDYSKLTLAGSIAETDLNANAPTDNYILTASSTAAGGFVWAANAATSEWTDAGDFVYPTGGEYAAFPYFQATSTTHASYASSSMHIQAVASGIALKLFENAGGEYWNVSIENDGDLVFKSDVSSNVFQINSADVANVETTGGMYIYGQGTGSVTSPTYSFNSDTNTGMYRDLADELSFTAGGVDFLRFTEDTTDVATLLQIWDAGNATSFEIPNGSNPTVDAAGEIAVNTGTTSVRYYDGTSEYQLKPFWSWGQNFASTTLSYDGNYGDGNSGTTTVKRAGFAFKMTGDTFYCRTDTGTAWVGFGNGSATTTVNCTTSGASSGTDVTWEARDWVLFDISTSTGNPNFIYTDVTSYWTTD